jgi:hypothetical protein
MAEQTASSDKPGGSSHIGAILGWGGLAVATMAFIWFISTQLAVGWEGREQEALDLVKNYKAPGMQFDLADQTIAVGNAAREKGGFVGQFSWSATQTEGPVYRVQLMWMENSANRRASWEVNLENETVTPEGEEAKKFMQPTG